MEWNGMECSACMYIYIYIYVVHICICDYILLISSHIYANGTNSGQSHHGQHHGEIADCDTCQRIFLLGRYLDIAGLIRY